MERVFLDANVLFSAAYRPAAKLAHLWSLPGMRLVSSTYALEEAARNLDEDARPRLTVLASQLEIFAAEISDLTLPVELADKDRPILAAAIASSCDVLLTGDRQHFGKLYGKEIQGVKVQTPAMYLQQIAKRIQ